jgi:DNA polymerase-3 subunit chi
MTETLFYELARRSIDATLPDLVERTLERGWRGVIRTESTERADAIDTLLWTYKEQSFLPHAQLGDGKAERQPVLITVEDVNPNGANVLFLVGGAEWPNLEAQEWCMLSRIVVIFDGRDETALARAEKIMKAATDLRHEVTWWKESAAGTFEKRTS